MEDVKEIFKGRIELTRVCKLPDENKYFIVWEQGEPLTEWAKTCDTLEKGFKQVMRLSNDTTK